MPKKAFDITKFIKNSTKSLDNIVYGFHDPKDWIDTGNYCLNKLISGDFRKGVPLGKVTMVAGDSGSGKSYICSGNLIRHAQEQGCIAVLLDTENALDEKWLQNLGVDTSPEKLVKFGVAMVDDVAKMMSDFMKGYREQHEGLDPKEDYDQFQKILFVVDSLGMLLTPTDQDQFEKGDMKGDLGRKAKSLTAFIRNTVNLIARFPVGLVVTNHTYATQEKYDPEGDKIAGGAGVMYASSIVLAINKLRLKNENAQKGESKYNGIRAAVKIHKTRYAKPFESVQVEIPYETGMDPYSGLHEFLVVKGKIEKSGNRWKYIDANGGEVLKFAKDYNASDYDAIMEMYDDATALNETVSIDGVDDVVDSIDVNTDPEEKKSSKKDKKAEV